MPIDLSMQRGSDWCQRMAKTLEVNLDDHPPVLCRNCQGSGKIHLFVPRNEVPGNRTVTCPPCAGTGDWTLGEIYRAWLAAQALAKE